MLRPGRTARFAIAIMGLTVVACGDDNHHDKPEVDQTDASSKVHRSDAGPDMDASRGADGARPDVQGSDPDGAAADGAVQLPVTDAAGEGMDAAHADATTPGNDASDVSATDANVDAGADGSRADAADAALGDAGSDASVHCDVTSARYGCGSQRGESWVVFDNGLEVDRDNNLGWGPIFDYTSTEDLLTKCNDLTLSGFTDFVVPDMDDVRTLASGCPQTTSISPSSPVSQCKVASTDLPESAAGTCSCVPDASTTGPHAGLFCKPDVPECVTLWSRTGCGPSCAISEFWFYDVTTGAIELHLASDALAQSAKGRCVTYINDLLLP